MSIATIAMVVSVIAAIGNLVILWQQLSGCRTCTPKPRPDPYAEDERPLTPAPSGWRDMATAPRDGSVIDADSGDGCPVAVRWERGERRWDPVVGAGYWQSGWVRHLTGEAIEPRRWIG